MDVEGVDATSPHILRLRNIQLPTLHTHGSPWDSLTECSFLRLMPNTTFYFIVFIVILVNLQDDANIIIISRINSQIFSLK